MVFLVPHDYFCNSTSFGPKIIPKGQFKVPKKVKEFCSFATFNKKPNFFRESHDVLRKTSTFLRKEYAGVKKASSISRFFAVNKRPLLDFKGQIGGFFKILAHI